MEPCLLVCTRSVAASARRWQGRPHATAAGPVTQERRMCASLSPLCAAAQRPTDFSDGYNLIAFLMRTSCDPWHFIIPVTASACADVTQPARPAWHGGGYMLPGWRPTCCAEPSSRLRCSQEGTVRNVRSTEQYLITAELLHRNTEWAVGSAWVARLWAGQEGHLPALRDLNHVWLPLPKEHTFTENRLVSHCEERLARTVTSRMGDVGNSNGWF